MSGVETSAPIDVSEMTVERAQEGFASGAFTSEDLTKAFLDRIQAVDAHYNAFVFKNPSAIDDAKASDARRKAGQSLGPLDGVPVVVKDAMDMAGFPTTGGWRLLYSRTGGVDLVPETDAPVVARMRSAGAVILGKTNIPILSWTGSHANDSWAGPTFNAAARDKLPGGSSTGTATAVATSMAVLGLAEETGGSIQNPASAQGLVGVKPTFGLVPNAGVLPLSSLRDVVGPIARCVRDAALALDALAGFTMADPKTVSAIGKRPPGGYAAGLKPDALRGKRIGTYGPGWRNLPLSEEASRLYQRALRELEAQGAALVSDPFAGSGFADLRTPTPPAVEFDGRGLESVPYDLGRYLDRLGPNASLKTFAEFAAATKSEDPFATPNGVLCYLPQLPAFKACLADPTHPPDMSSFVALREQYLSIFMEIFAKHKLDALLFPQMRQELAARESDDIIHETTVSEINIAGLPGVTAPAGAYESGSPFNLIVIGPMWSEAELLGVAFAYEQGTRYRKAPTLTAPKT